VTESQNCAPCEELVRAGNRASRRRTAHKVASIVVGNVSMHQAPWPLDRIEVRAVARNECSLMRLTGPRQPLLHQSSVVIARIVEKDMDEHRQWIKCFDRFEQRDC
jgi:hypothetical protein